MKVRGRERCFSGILRLHKTPTPRQPLTIAMIILFLAFLSYVVCGCGSSSSTKNLKDYANKLGFEFDQPWITASARGTIEKSLKEKDLTYVKVQVSRFEILPGPYQVKNPEISPGTEIVFVVGNPKEKFPEGKKVEATIRIVKTEKGFKLFAENTLVLK